jgi:SOS-response transcriptional repressor LexA
MQTKGYMIGDEVKADARIVPVDGDVVVANLYDTQGKARTVLRVFKSPGYLVPATADATSIEVHEAGKTAAIFGVVFESSRRRSIN